MSDAPPPYDEKAGFLPQDQAYPPPQGYPPQTGYPPQDPGYPPPAAGYPPQQPTTVITAAPAVVVAAPLQYFGESPVNMTCPHCNASIITATTYDTGLLTWLAAGGICLVGCWAGCCLIPFCVDACKDVIHTCPSCKVMVGKYQRIK